MCVLLYVVSVVHVTKWRVFVVWMFIRGLRSLWVYGFYIRIFFVCVSACVDFCVYPSTEGSVYL